MNVHHLELFYYVARHRGVSAAARHIPYGIQQPAISAQIIQLENSLGTALFTRRPFSLTRQGEELYRFIQPFFGGISEMEQRLRGQAEVSLRIGAIETVQRQYLPQLLKSMRQRVPALHFTLLPAALEEIEARLLARELDLGVAPLFGKRPAGIQQREIIRVPLALLAPKNTRLRSPEALWKQDRITERLITGPAENPVCRLFQAELQKRQIEWFTSIELSSQPLIASYVAEGFGFGLIIAEPGLPPPKGTRLWPLTDFPVVAYGILWAGELSPLQTAFVEEATKLAATFQNTEED